MSLIKDIHKNFHRRGGKKMTGGFCSLTAAQKRRISKGEIALLELQMLLSLSHSESI